MDKAKNIEELAGAIADRIGCGCTVRYNPATLEYGDYMPDMLDEYGDYIDMKVLPDDIGDRLIGWQIEAVKSLRETLALPEEIGPPRTRAQFGWMADFANDRRMGPRFAAAAQRALDSRHPFGAFRRVMAVYGLLDDWNAYRSACYEAYVRHEMVTVPRNQDN